MARRRRTVALVVLNVAQVLLALAVFAVHTEAARAETDPGWSWPLPGSSSVDRPFAPPATAWGAGHRGVDLRGYFGEPVLAAGEGRVTYAGLLAGRGVVTVTHPGGLRTTYEPVRAGLPVGTQVAAGDQIGTLASGHASCRPGTECLHWGLLRGSTYLDPLSLVVQGRLRLLPLKGLGTPALQVATVADVDEPVPPVSQPEAVTHPRKRAGRLFLDASLNVATVAAIGYGVFAGSRRLVRRFRRIRRRA